MTVTADPDLLVLDVARLGRAGEGLAERDGAPLAVPFALPGERVRVAREGERARIVDVLTASPDRVPPPCPHFSACGGCALQHLAPAAIAAWKRERIGAALAAAGLQGTVEPVATVPLASRRRIVVAVQRQEGRTVVGFRERLSHRVVPLAACPVTRPRLVAALPALVRLAEHVTFGAKGASVTLLDTLGGVDVAIAEADLKSGRGQALVAAAVEAGFARLALAGEVLVEARPPLVRIGRVPVVPPPGAFLQASAEAEDLLADAVLAATAGARRVADLFAGIGTFTFRLAERAAVHAVEGDKPALAALAAAARRAPGLKPVTSEARDLNRRPLTPAELDRFEAVVFDPPRDGAAPQAKMLAKSRVPVIVAVSCNPQTLVRDLRYLVDAGYQLERVLPVDQFLFTPHIEVVAVLRR